MAKFKPCNENQMVMLPISLQDQLVPGTLEHTINRLVDENIDLSVFDERYKNDLTGAAAMKTSSSLPSRMGMPPTIARLLPLSLRCKTRSLPSSVTFSWYVKN